jgi:hypothetical protein
MTEKQKIDRCIYLAGRIKDSLVLRRNIKKRNAWLDTLIEELQALKEK